MRIVFGIDGGGTSTRLRIADGDNRALWEGRGEGINPNAVAPAEIAERLASLFSAAFNATGFAAGDFDAGCLGVAGAERASEQAELDGILRDRLRLTCPLRITSDPDIALVGGLKCLEGYLLIAGTGSIAIARLADGARFRAGGLGHFMSDEGSAFFLGFQAIRRALRSVEGRDLPTAMLEPLMERFGLKDRSEFVPLIYRRFDKAGIGGAANIVERYRAAGDPLAVSIMEEAREELVNLVVSVRAQALDRIASPRILLAGGLFEHNAWLRAAVIEGLKKTCPELAPTEAVESAAFGACMLALSESTRLPSQFLS
ncbi:MAG: BadF/BadG/BcrA/BcrD ATPase family protein [Rectinemataceae bacterium]|nr:BadF/BadG/BcrA/BcrD ATPase family protein [Rectinemataceae bacterium]